MAYRKYDQKTMFLISKSKNPNLFPQLNIPSSTAMYWINNEIHLNKPLRPRDCRVSDIEILRNKLSKAQEENRKLKACNKCLRSYIKILNQKNLIKPIKDPFNLERP